MDIRELQQNWNRFGNDDAMWAVLTSPDKEGKKWQSDEFFQTGVEHIQVMLQYFTSLNLTPNFGKALDFGCGVGRLTQALGDHYDFVYGVDIAASMIEQAKAFNRHNDKCQYYVNSRDDLQIFADNTFDLVNSYITLQHIPPMYSKKYMQEFIRILAPQGMLTFQMPEQPVSMGKLIQLLVAKQIKAGQLMAARFSNLQHRYRRLRKLPVMEMHGVTRNEVVQLIENEGGKVLDIKRDEADLAWVSYQYIITKP